MKKIKSKFVCKNCGFVSLKWEGCCPNCLEWNTLNKTDDEEFYVESNNFEKNDLDLKNLNLIKETDEVRFDTGFLDLNILFGGGIVKGSICLIGGEPGIGKSTLLLQICGSLAKTRNVLHVSGEENENQIKIRANRLKIFENNILILIEFNVKKIIAAILKEKPDLVVVDSVQTINYDKLASFSGSVAQIRECSHLLQKVAKKENISIILVGHVNKEGIIAGPKVLEHIVDVVLYFEGDSNNSFRILRVVKNRFGSVNEIAVFEMKQTGLKAVVNPSAFLINDREKFASSSFICAVMEGKRPFFVEVQSLVLKSGFGLPRRLSKGLDYNRLIIIIAVLEKRVKLFFNSVDCYVNVVGGFKLKDPACDLAVALSLVCALKNKDVFKDLIVLGEIGLAGEIRAVSGVFKTVLEAEKLGFKKIIMPYYNLKNLENLKTNIQLVGVKNVSEAVENILK